MANIQWNSVGSGVLRDNAYQLNNATSAWERCTLLEYAATNLVLQSDTLATTWSAGAGTPVATSAVATHANRPFSSLAYTTAWGTDYLKQAVTFTGDGVKAFSLLLHQNGTDAGTWAWQVYDTTSAASRLTVTATVAAGGGITASAGTGTLLKTVSLVDGAYRIDVQTTSVTAAHSHEVRLGTAGTCPSIQISGVQASDNLVPSSLIPTTTATVTRAADVAYLDLAGTALAVPREATFYIKFVEVGGIALAGTSASIAVIGDFSTASTNTLALSVGSSTYRVIWYNGSSGTIVAAVAAPSLNDQVELLAYIDPTGKPHLTQAINGVAAATVDGSSAQTFQAAFKTTKLYLASSAGALNGLLGLQAFKAVPGNYTLAQMRGM